MLSAIFTPVLRKPNQSWLFEENPLGDILCTLAAEEYGPSLILPKGISDKDRDLALWAYEFGRIRGHRDGAETTQRKVRDAIGIR